MKYPKECPVFEVVAHGPLCRVGALVEFIGTGDGVSPYTATVHHGVVWFRIVDDGDCLNEAYRAASIAFYGFAGVAAQIDAVRPLTAAARDMLALVRRG